MIDIFNNKYQIINRHNNIITYFIMLMIILILIILNIIFNYKYYIFDAYVGFVDNDYNLELYVKEEDVSSLNSYSLFIENEKYEFKVLEISEESFNIDNEKYYQLKLNVRLNKKYLIKNNVLNVRIKKRKTTIYQQIKEEIKKWIN